MPAAAGTGTFPPSSASRRRPCLAPGGGRDIEAQAPTRPSVLVVDDDPAILELIRSHLEAEFDVVTTCEPSKATDLTRSRRFDLHLYDLSMEPMPGLELMLLTLATSADAAIVLMTGEPSVERAVEALRTGATDLLLKPLQFDRLSSALWRAL